MDLFFKKTVKDLPEQQDNKSTLFFLLMLFAVIFGCFVRLKGLGEWPLAVDEYYIAQSVKNILRTGLPQFESGGYYMRGLILQYLATPLLHFFPNDEFALRLLPVFFNILAFFPIFLLGKKVAGEKAGYLAIIFFSLSVWEIEMARFARMYTPFQALFLWWLFFLYKVVIEDDQKSEHWMHGVSVLAIFMHEASIFLLVLNFLPLAFVKKHLEPV